MPNANNTIVLKGDLGRRYEEGRSGTTAIYPGHLIELNTDNELQPHATRGGGGEVMFAIEDALQGNTVDDAYGTDDDDNLVRYFLPVPGDEIYARLKAGENVNEGDKLISYGDGNLAKGASAYLNVNTADSTTVTNTTTETTFSNGTVTIPKNSLKAGDTVRIRGAVRFPSTNSTDTATVRVKLGATTILTIPATDVADNDVAFFDITVTIRTIGATGTLVAVAQYSIGVLGTATTRTQTLASTAIDTTANKDVTVTVQWSVANAGNQAILSNLLIEHVKTGSGSVGGEAGGKIIGICREAVDLSGETDDDWVKIRIPN